MSQSVSTEAQVWMSTDDLQAIINKIEAEYSEIEAESKLLIADTIALYEENHSLRYEIGKYVPWSYRPDEYLYDGVQLTMDKARRYNPLISKSSDGKILINETQARELDTFTRKTLEKNLTGLRWQWDKLKRKNELLVSELKFHKDQEVVKAKAAKPAPETPVVVIEKTKSNLWGIFAGIALIVIAAAFILSH